MRELWVAILPPFLTFPCLRPPLLCNEMTRTYTLNTISVHYLSDSICDWKQLLFYIPVGWWPVPRLALFGLAQAAALSGRVDRLGDPRGPPFHGWYQCWMAGGLSLLTTFQPGCIMDVVSRQPSRTAKVRVVAPPSTSEIETERQRIQSQSQLCSRFKASLGYMKLYLKFK